MRKLTLWDVDLEHHIDEVARERGVPFDEAALLLLRKGAGLEQVSRAAPVVGNALDRFIGTWSSREEKELLEAVQAFDRVDESFWS